MTKCSKLARELIAKKLLSYFERVIENIRILTAEMELACKGGSCGRIVSNTNIFNGYISSYEPHLLVSVQS